MRGFFCCLCFSLVCFINYHTNVYPLFMNSLDDVIVALATPVGEGGLAVVRISGKSAISIVDKSFRGKIALVRVPTHTAHFGVFFNEKKQKIDEVIVTVFRLPHSYTGEDSVEISCHGGTYIVKKIIECLINSGARQAEPGEFTKRAFLNGRIDLSQAEAVADLIHASSENAHKLSLSQLEGRLSHKIEQLKEKLVEVCSLLELELDFIEEGIDLVKAEKVTKEMRGIGNQIDLMISSYESGRLSKEGVRVVIIGAPNVGKSSIFNSLLDSERAIVTPIEGTTRDSIEESINVNGMRFNLVDTAGIRNSEDIVEIEGIKRTYAELKNSDIAILVEDCTNLNYCNVFLDKIKDAVFQKATLIKVLNKFDLVGFDEAKIPNKTEKDERILFSAKTGFGVGEVKSKLLEISTSMGAPEITDGIVLTNLRHLNCLKEARVNISSAIKAIEHKVSNEFIISDLRTAINAMEIIIGKVTNDDILNKIFSTFCIGK